MSSDLSRTFFKLSFAVNIAVNKLIAFVSRNIPRKKITIIIEQGTLQGLQYKTKLSDKPYYSFLGIPYAKPPVNDLRFQPPIKHPGWPGVLKAFSEGNKCLQYDIVMANKIIGDEDCLFLNVFTPAQEEANEKLRNNLPVMLFIHGGIFNFGSGSLDEYSPDYLLDENVVVVTINYRLNVLGFLNFGIDECPGNVGLKDQLFAIKWVKSNISAFGGDPDNITIFGESAGAASVHCHTLSPQSTGYFQKAIMQSGCMFNTWAIQEKHREIAHEMAKNLGCQETDPKEIVKFLKKVSAIDLVRATKFEGIESDFYFVPSVESEAVRDPFLPAHPEILAKSSPPPVPVICGLNDMEGLIGFGEENMSKLNDFHKPNEINKLFKNKYNEEVLNKICDFYFNEGNLENETTKLEYICHLHSDVYFVKDFHRGLNHFLTQGITPVYHYEFKFDGEINTFKNLILGSRPELRKLLKGACHADELSYLFYGQLFRFAPKPNTPEFRMCRLMSKLWTNFAKTGDPNSPDLNIVWNSTKADDPKYLSIDGDNTRMVDGLLYSSRVNFWNEISDMLQSDQTT